MTTSEIFKMLSQGATFRRNVTPKKNQLDEIVIKQEVADRLIVKEENEPELTLLGSITTTKKGNKRKRKMEDDEEVARKRKLLEEEKINQYRNQNNITAVGRHIPKPAKSFEDMNLDRDSLDTIKKCGYTEPTAIQKQGIPIMLNNRHMLACAPTGSGKTLAFLLPIIKALKEPDNKGFRALIICPTRELAKQTQKECTRLSEGRGFRIHILSKIKQALTQYGIKSNGKYDILITTPNRLCYLLKQDPPAISLTSVEWIVVDEADKLFEEGVRGFREQLDKILTACGNPDKRIAMFSATYTPIVAKWCVHSMKGLIRVTIGLRNSATTDVSQELLFVGSEEGKLLAIRDLVRKGINPPVLIFVQSKERAQQLYRELVYDGINVDAIHADRSQQQRDETIRAFREGTIWVLICTELMARGVDFKGVNLVINYDFPPTAIAYIHRIGRAGRAGRKGKAITFFTIEDTVNLRSIAYILKQSGQEVPEFMLAIKKHSKRDVKKLKVSAPKRKDISTKPIYEVLRNEKWKRNEKRKVNSQKKRADPTNH